MIGGGMSSGASVNVVGSDTRVERAPLVRRMFFMSEHLKAEEFRTAGGAIVVTTRDALIDTAKTMARKIAGFSPTAVRLAKQILNRIETMDLKTGYEFEQGFTVRMSGHPDSKEALRAFGEKRAPDYAKRTPGWSIEA